MFFEKLIFLIQSYIPHPQANSSDISFISYLKVYLVLGIIIGIIFALYYFVKKKGLVKGMIPTESQCKVMWKYALTSRAFIMCVKIDSEYYILGVTDSNISLIDKKSSPEN